MIGFSLLGVVITLTLVEGNLLEAVLIGIMVFCTILQSYGIISLVGAKLNGLWHTT